MRGLAGDNAKMERILKERFYGLWALAGAKIDAYPALESIEALYSAPERHYHTLEHVDGCLGELDSARQIAENPLSLEFALWYHDAIYVSNRTDNEENSAWFMAGTLSAAGLHPELISRIKGLILATKHDRKPADSDRRLVSDIDLAILGMPEDIFDDYCLNIWKEYSWMGPENYTQERIKALENILRINKGHIYYTEFFRQKYENMAASNLIRTLNVLNGLDEEF